MRNPVECLVRFFRVILLIGLALAAAGDRLGWAARTRAPNMVSPAGTDLAGQDRAELASAPPVSESLPRMAGPGIALDVMLVGTAVVEGGPSFAVFEGAKGSRLVREGEEIVPGVRLVQVDWNWIDVERGGIRQEIRLGSREGMPGRVALGTSERAGGGTRVSAIGSRQARSEAASAAARRLRETGGQTLPQRGQEMRDRKR